MGSDVRAFIKSLLHGARETPKGYFAPAIAVWRLLVSTTESLMDKPDQECGVVADSRRNEKP